MAWPVVLSWACFLEWRNSCRRRNMMPILLFELCCSCLPCCCLVCPNSSDSIKVHITMTHLLWKGSWFKGNISGLHLAGISTIQAHRKLSSWRGPQYLHCRSTSKTSSPPKAFLSLDTFGGRVSLSCYLLQLVNTVAVSQETRARRTHFDATSRWIWRRGSMRSTLMPGN